MLSLDTCRCFLCELFQGVSSIPSPEQAEVSGPVLRTDGSVFPPFIWGQSTCVVCDDGDKGPGAINWAATSYRSTWLMSDSLNPANDGCKLQGCQFPPILQQYQDRILTQTDDDWSTGRPLLVSFITFSRCTKKFMKDRSDPISCIH